MRRALAIALLALTAHAQPCNPAVLAIGDSRTANRNDGQVPWPSQVQEVYVANYAVGGTVWSQCASSWDTANTSEPHQHGRTAAACGVNDLIINSADGHTLFATEKTWVESHATAANVVYWFNIPGFKTFDSTASKLTARNNFNSDLASYCLSPATYVRCVDIATPLQDSIDHDKLAAAYDIGDGLHFNTAGHAVVASTFQAVFP